MSGILPAGLLTWWILYKITEKFLMSKSEIAALRRQESNDRHHRRTDYAKARAEACKPKEAQPFTLIVEPATDGDSVFTSSVYVQTCKQAPLSWEFEMPV